jgi:hypothetical protein
MYVNALTHTQYTQTRESGIARHREGRVRRLRAALTVISKVCDLPCICVGLLCVTVCVSIPCMCVLFVCLICLSYINPNPLSCVIIMLACTHATCMQIRIVYRYISLFFALSLASYLKIAHTAFSYIFYYLNPCTWLHCICMPLNIPVNTFVSPSFRPCVLAQRLTNTHAYTHYTHTHTLDSHTYTHTGSSERHAQSPRRERNGSRIRNPHRQGVSPCVLLSGIYVPAFLTCTYCDTLSLSLYLSISLSPSPSLSLSLFPSISFSLSLTHTQTQAQKTGLFLHRVETATT